ncbi:Potassium efflux system KefA protein / Small-conductance mechanosensitive channel [Azospirillum argentinense]|uniref:mechanosensitive ion channel domain-containing protein n=1 Tax=Azospirillum argentinense TaxID=2970906 RepID=UPI0032E00FC8
MTSDKHAPRRAPRIFPARCRAPRGFLALLLLIVALGSVAVPASAQIPVPAQTPPAAASPSPEEIARLRQTLEDPERRAALIGQLRALEQVETAAEPDEPEGIGTRLLTLLSERLDGLGREAALAGDVLVNAPQGLRWLERQAADPAQRAAWGWLAAGLALVVVVGQAARLVAIRTLRRPREMLAARPVHSVIAKVPLLLVRALFDLAPIVAFAAAGFGVLALFDPPPVVRVLGVTFLNASIFVQLVLLVVRALVAPGSPNLRLLPMGDESAMRLLRWCRTIAITTLYGMFLAEAARRLGLPAQSHGALVTLVGLAVAVMLAALVLQSREAVAGWLRGEIAAAQPLSEAVAEGPPGRRTAGAGRMLRAAGRRVADVWHAVAILYIIVLFGIWALEIRGGLLFVVRATAVTLVVAGVARLAGRLIVRASAALVERMNRRKGHAAWAAGRVRRYVEPTARLLQGMVALAAGMVVLEAWGLDVWGWLQTAIGLRIVASGLSLLLVGAIALAVWEVTNALIERHLATTDRNGRAIQRSARVRTLLPLLRSALLVVILTLVTLITLSELGLNIGPLLAGAGVVGLAVGFGAQTLVKDLITGLFILFEDTISVGDVVNVGGKGGLVEGMNIRTIRLRDFDGTVHTIPFSAVTSVSNMTKDFSYYVFDVAIPYHENADRVVSVLHGIGDELRKDPRFAPLILEPLEVLGVDSFQESAAVIKARIKTLPIQQWNVGRAFNGRMKARFIELGIDFPLPQRTLHIARGAAEALAGMGGEAGAANADRMRRAGAAE